MQDPTQRAKTACPELPASGYQPASDVGDALTVEVMDCGLALPTRLRFDPSAQVLLVAQLRGVVEAFERAPDDTWIHQTPPLHDLGDLRVQDEAGLTSIFFGVDFDLDAPEPSRRDLFLTYQRVDRDARNVIRRVTLERQGDRINAVDPVDIWVSSDRTGQAHQIQDGFGLLHEGAPHIVVAVGDGNASENARDPGRPNGTLQMLQRDGSAPLGSRPWPEHPSTVAIGLRNTYSLLRLPASVDPRQGFIGLENGNRDNDRAWFVRLFPPSGPPARMDLGYSGDDRTSAWTAFGDPHTPSALGGNRTAVFRIFSPPVSPTGAALHPGGGIIPEPGVGQTSFVVAFFGVSGSTLLTPGKTIDRLTLSNVEGAALQSDRQTLIERAPETEGEFRHPVGLDVDPQPGDIWFSDIITGELTRVRI